MAGPWTRQSRQRRKPTILVAQASSLWEVSATRKNHHMRKSPISATILCALIFSFIARADIVKVPNPEKFKKESTEKPRDTGPSRLAPVYAPLAEWLVARYNLADKSGIGVDIGGGSGSLVIELCKRSPKMHWINLDINPSVFPDFFRKAQEAGVGGQVSAIFSDAQWMALRDD